MACSSLSGNAEVDSRVLPLFQFGDFDKKGEFVCDCRRIVRIVSFNTRDRTLKQADFDFLRSERQVRFSIWGFEGANTDI